MTTERAGAVIRLASFIAKFSLEHQALIQAVRKALRRRFPTAHELVYDNYNFFVIGYCPTEKPSDCLISIVASSNGVGLCFTHGASLPDPTGILAGSGKQTRSLHLEAVNLLKRPEAKELLRAAEAQAKVAMPAIGRGQLIIRSVSLRQRPRRKMPNQSSQTTPLKRRG
jgi:hypothetical protein